MTASLHSSVNQGLGILRWLVEDFGMVLSAISSSMRLNWETGSSSNRKDCSFSCRSHSCENSVQSDWYSFHFILVVLRRLSDFQLILDGGRFRINLGERSKRNPKTETDGRKTDRCTKKYLYWDEYRCTLWCS